MSQQLLLAAAEHCAPPTTLRSAHEVLDADARRDMLERSYRGEQLELFLDAVVFEQTPGVPNRKFLRFDEGILRAVAASGKGTPFLRNHEQWDIAAIGGRVTGSKAVAAPSGGAVQFHQTVRLTVPWAVQTALQGGLERYSIGWRNLPPKGKVTPQVHCSICAAPVDACLFAKGHWRGTECDGRVVEWISLNAELVETSGVVVPAVPTVRPIEIRNAHHAFGELRVLGAELQALGVQIQVPGAPASAERQEAMSLNYEMLTVLGLAAGADDAAVLAAINQLKATAAEEAAKRAALEQRLAQSEALAAETRAKLAKVEGEKATAEATAWLEKHVAEGRVPPEGELYEHLLGLARTDRAKAEALVQALPKRPIGAERQTERRQSRKPALEASGEIDYAALGEQLPAADKAAAQAAGIDLAVYVRANYEELAEVHGWPAEAQ